MSVNLKSLKPQTRSAAIVREQLPEGSDGRFAFVLSTESPVSRWFGEEILEHSKSAIRTKRLDAGIPLLFNHDPDQHLGLIDEYTIANSRLSVAGKWGTSALAQEKQRDYDAGILKDSSVGYLIHKVTREQEGEYASSDDKVTATDWEPVEGSLVTIPADIDSGVGRKLTGSKSDEFPVEEVISRRSIAPPTPAPAAQPKEGSIRMEGTEDKAALELARTQAIYGLAADKDFGKHYSIADAQRDIAANVAFDKVRDDVTRKIVSANDKEKVGTLGDNVFGELSKAEQARFSEARLIRSIINSSKPGTFQDADATLEREVSDVIAKRMGKSGYFVPTNLRGNGYVGASTTTAGVTGQPALIKTTTEGDMIPLLRNRPMVQLMGATVMGGLVGNIRIPRQTGAGTAYWLGEHGGVPMSDVTTDYVGLVPRRLSSQNGYTFELVRLTSTDVDQLLRDDQDKVRRLALDLAAIAGTGQNGQPTGILNTTGLVLITPTGATLTNGKMLSYEDILAFEEAPADANADVATSGWMFTPGVRRKLKATPMFGTGIAEAIWPRGSRSTDGIVEGPEGYKAAVTNQLPKNLPGANGNNLHAGIFGDFSNLILADWGAEELIVDPFTRAGNAEVLITKHSLNDVAVRHIEGFAASVAIAVA